MSLAFRCALVFAGCVGAEIAYAQGEAQDPWAGVEEMLVTGGATAGLLDMGKGDSVLAFDSDKLEGIGAQDISDIAAFTPNLSINTPGGGSQATFFIRGVGLNDFSANASGAIAIYQDDVPIGLPATQLRAIFDVEGVTVLRGPEGGTRIRNATAGAIKVASRRPSGELGAYMKGTYGTYNLRVFEGALESPIIPDLLSARVAFQTTDRDGWTRNGCAGAPAAGRPVRRSRRDDSASYCGESVRVRFDSDLPANLPEDVNDEHNWALRGILRLETEIGEVDHDWLLNVHGESRDQFAILGQHFGTSGVIPDPLTGLSTDLSRSLQNRLGGTSGTANDYRDPDVTAIEREIVDSIPLDQFASAERPPRAREGVAFPILANRLARDLDSDPFRGDYNNVGRNKRDNWGITLRGDIGLASDTQLQTITGFERYTRSNDADTDFTPLVLFEQMTEDDAWQITQELFIAHDFDGVLSLEVGGLMLREELDARIVRLRPVVSHTVGTIDPRLVGNIREYSQDTWDAGAFVRADWSPSESFRIDVGARYNWSEKKFIFGFQDGDIRSGVSTSQSWDRPTYHARLFFEPTADVQFYAKFTHGWRSGHFNATANARTAVTVAKPETVNSWETGFVTSWFDGRLDVNFAAFYYRYKNYQVFVTNRSFDSPPEQIITNAKDAQNYGIELDVVAEPFDGLMIEANLGWIESEFLDFVTTRLVQQTVSLAPPITINDEISEDFSGARLPNSPRLQFSLAVSYDIEIPRLGRFKPEYRASWTDDVNFDQTSGRGLTNLQGQIFLPKHTIGQQGFWRHNLRLEYATPGSDLISVAVWARNITNEQYKVFSFQADDFVAAFIGDPRTYGVDLTLSW